MSGLAFSVAPSGVVLASMRHRLPGLFSLRSCADCMWFTFYPFWRNHGQRVMRVAKLGDPCEQPKQLSDADLETCTAHRGYDYFAGSELSYITAITCLALVPFGKSATV